MAAKRVKVSDFIEAIKRDEIKWYKGGWFNTLSDDENIGAACVMGIGCINAGIGTDFYMNKAEEPLSFSSVRRKREISGVIVEITSFNDRITGGAKTWEEARDYAIEKLTPYADLAFWAEEHEYNVTRTVKEEV